MTATGNLSTESLDKELGKVERVFFGYEDHGILTCYVHLNFGGSGQGFGGYALDEPSGRGDYKRVGTAGGLDFLIRLLTLFKVDELPKIVGRTVYAIRNERRGAIIGLEIPPFDGGGSFLVKEWSDRWFPDEAARG